MAKLELMSAAGVDQTKDSTFFRFGLKSIRWALFADPRFAAHLPFPRVIPGKRKDSVSEKGQIVELQRRVAVRIVPTGFEPCRAAVRSC